MFAAQSRGRALVLTGGLFLASLAWLLSAAPGTAEAGKGKPALKPKGERHPHLHRAIRELREAKVDLEKAAHDYGGHCVAAIKDIDKALHQLNLALKFDPPKGRRKAPPAGKTTTAPTAPPAPAAAPAAPGKERHPLIHKALRKLHAAKKNLETAAHDFGGHRVAAIKDVNGAIGQLKKALAYDKK